MQRIAQKIKAKKTVIGIIGLGYVGLLIVIRFAEDWLAENASLIVDTRNAVKKKEKIHGKIFAA